MDAQKLKEEMELTMAADLSNLLVKLYNLIPSEYRDDFIASWEQEKFLNWKGDVLPDDVQSGILALVKVKHRADWFIQRQGLERSLEEKKKNHYNPNL